MKCKECGYVATEIMNYCPMCGKPFAGYVRRYDSFVHRVMAQKLLEAVKVTEEVKAKLERREKYEEAVAEIGKLCSEFLAEAEEWMKENPNGSRYCNCSSDMCEKLDIGIADEPIYFCCNVLGDGNEFFAVTRYGLKYVTESCCGKPMYFYFDELNNVSFAEGNLVFNDMKERIKLGITEEEGKKLVELLHKAYELIADLCGFDELEEEEEGL